MSNLTESQEKTINELGFEQAFPIRVKPVTMPPKTPDIVQERDTFQTPKYATELLIPYIPRNIKNIWECAAGEGKISKELINNGFTVYSSDIRKPKTYGFECEVRQSFTTDTLPFRPYVWERSKEKFAIITNPPFSIKYEFIEKAFKFKVPFAFLINADYSERTINLIKRGCQKIVPDHRVAYITPNTLNRIHEGEVWEVVKRLPEYNMFRNLKEIKEDGTGVWDYLLEKEEYRNLHLYNSVDEVPQNLLYKYTSPQFHSMWLTYGFDLGASEIFVDLPIKQRKENI